MYKIIFAKKAKKQFYSLSRDIQERITKKIDNQLAINPDTYLIPLIGNMYGLYKFKVGSYRLLCFKKTNEFLILVVKVGHRKDIYR